MTSLYTSGLRYKNQRLVRWALAATVLLGLVPFSLRTFANTPGVLTETVTLQRGAVFEIATDVQTAAANYSWIFSHNGTFLEAKRSPAFRTRLIEAGTYVLNGEISDQHAQHRQKMLLTIIVPESGGSAATQTSGDGQHLVSTVPAADAQGRILTNNAQHIIQLIPASQTTPLRLDLDSETDSDRDGDPTNDDDIPGTFFGSRGTPLFLWLTNATAHITITGQLQDGTIRTQTLRLLSQSAALQEDERTRKRIEIVPMDGENGTVFFDVEYVNMAPDGPMLYHWDFGDGSQSLLDRPVHTYAQNGVFTVHLTVRNLQTGAVTEEIQTPVHVNTILAPVTGEPEHDEEKSGAGRVLFGLFIKILAVALIALLIGLGAVFVIAKLRSRISLQEKIEHAEKKLVGDRNNAEEESVSPPPLEVTAIDDEPVSQPPSEKDSEHVPEQPEERPAEMLPETPPPESTSDEPAETKTQEPLPDWLQPATTSAATPAEPTPPPPPPAPTPPQQETVAKPPVSTQSATQKQERPPAAQTERVPDWLQANQTPSPPATVPPPQAPSSAPAPEQQTVTREQSAPKAPAPPATVPPSQAPSSVPAPEQQTTTPAQREQSAPKAPAPPAPKQNPQEHAATKETPEPPPATAPQPPPPAAQEQGSTPPWLQTSASTPPAPQSPPVRPKQQVPQNNRKKPKNHTPPQPPQPPQPPEAPVKPEAASTQEQHTEEEPIAFIRAESIDEQQETRSENQIPPAQESGQKEH